ncbi:MAG: hypothetical protein AAFO89_04770 [Planctomycetota bacterium]
MGRVLLGLGSCGLGCCLVGPPGCAVHWYDKETGTAHVLGIGHLAVKVTEPDDHGVRAIVRESSSIGLNAGVHESGGYAGVGYHADRRMRIRDDTNLWIGWVGNSLFRTWVGAMPPWWNGVPDGGAAPSDWDTAASQGEAE